MKIAINGFGRIGRAFFRRVLNSDLEVVAINDLGDVENLAYLLKRDTAYGTFNKKVEIDGSDIIVDDNKIKFLSEPDPSKLPWKDLDIDIVVESTGVFTNVKDASKHVEAGAKRVVITANPKGEPISSIGGDIVLMGINNDKLANCKVSSNSSCTTNAASPVTAIINEKIGIEKALLNTIHGYTSSQGLVDGPSKKDWRRGRAAALNIVPSTTGAAKAVAKAVPDIPFFDGMSVRVPVVVGSYIDLTFVTKKETNAEEINSILREASREGRWQGIFTTSDEPLVSSDIIGNDHASIADLAMTKVVGGNLVKVLSWYDNEWGYANTLMKHISEYKKYI